MTKNKRVEKDVLPTAGKESPRVISNQGPPLTKEAW
jgi:hypothetical protein